MNNRFISETEVEEAKKKREEEWEKARAAGRKLPKEDEIELKDTRSLYERLKEQKDKKQEEFEEKLKFKNMIYKGLNDEDASFLGFVAKKQAEIDQKRFDDESEELQEYRAALNETNISQPSSDQEKVTRKQKVASDYIIKKNQQASILSSSIIRKRKSVEKVEEDGSVSNKTTKLSANEEVEKEDQPSKSGAVSSLASLADYSSSDDDAG